MTPGSEHEAESSPRRKHEQLELCSNDGVAFRAKSTLLEEVELVHDALPELALDDVDLSTQLLGKTLRAPIVISSMTGGTEETARVSRDLALVAERLGLGFGIGSQRAMAADPALAWAFDVRGVAPNVLLLGNVGLVQARSMSTRAVRELCDRIGADALCIHLNPAMELIQPGGDRDFRGGRETLARLAGELGLPLVVKETGSGLSRRVGRVVRELGIATVDVSGAGGTSWVGVETRRARDGARRLGEELWDWGIPTAASVAMLSELDLAIVATGGLRTGLDVARAIALGARAGGLAAPCLRAHKAAGVEGVASYLGDVVDALRAAHLLTGSRTPDELRRAPRVLGPTLRAWIDARS